MKELHSVIIFCAFLGISFSVGCKEEPIDVETVVEVDPNLFLSGGLAEPITIETRTLSNGESVECYKIVSNGTPTDHNMGPWCPDNISDGEEAGGIWLENDQVYDVDGEFVKNMATFYSDNTWLMYDVNGDIYTTDTKDECQAAANPNVGPEYKNFCVECLPSYVSALTQTYYIPVKPVLLSSTASFSGGPFSSGPSTRGVAFNGVRFDAPAPKDAILGAYTLAPFDDAGGHINLAAGYHYHAATGQTKQIAQADGHAAMIGYAMDGHGLYEQLDVNGAEPDDLDECRGHYDDTRGYHYHVAAPGTNNFIDCLHGGYAN